MAGWNWLELCAHPAMQRAGRTLAPNWNILSVSLHTNQANPFLSSLSANAWFIFG